MAFDPLLNTIRGNHSKRVMLYLDVAFGWVLHTTPSMLRKDLYACLEAVWRFEMKNVLYRSTKG